MTYNVFGGTLNLAQSINLSNTVCSLYSNDETQCSYSLGNK